MSTLWTPPNAKTLPRAGLPQGDVRLGDGRLLKQMKMWEPNRWSRGFVYTTDDGLLVIASVDNTENHGRLLHVSLSYADHDPGWADARGLGDSMMPATCEHCLIIIKVKDLESATQQIHQGYHTDMTGTWRESWGDVVPRQAEAVLGRERNEEGGR